MDPLSVALLLYVAAVGLATIDLFVPSGGMLVVLAAVGAIGSVLFGFRSSTTAGMSMLTLVMGSIPVFLWLAVQIWPHTPIGKRIILKTPPAQPAQSPVTQDPLLPLIGHVLLAETPLLPTGQLRLGHHRLNAVAESGFIEAGQRVKIMAVRERNLVVRLTDEPLTSTSGAAESVAAADSELPPEKYLELPAEQLGLDSLDN